MGNIQAPGPGPQETTPEQLAYPDVRDGSHVTGSQIPTAEWSRSRHIRAQHPQQEENTSSDAPQLRTSTHDVERSTGGLQALSTSPSWDASACQTDCSTAAAHPETITPLQELSLQFPAACGRISSAPHPMALQVSPSEADDHQFALSQQPLLSTLDWHSWHRSMCGINPQENTLQHHVPRISGAMEDQLLNLDLTYLPILPQ